MSESEIDFYTVSGVNRDEHKLRNDIDSLLKYDEYPDILIDEEDEQWLTSGNEQHPFMDEDINAAGVDPNLVQRENKIEE